MINRVIQIDKKPLIFCRDCKNGNTWERDTKRDVKVRLPDGTEKINNFAYKCRVCGATDLRTYKPELGDR